MKPNSILIIDADSSTLDNAAKLLELVNYNVVKADSARRGLELFKKLQPNLILSGTSQGFVLLRMLEKFPEAVAVPIVLMGPKTDKNGMRKALDSGADDYLTTPFSDDELIHVVEMRLKKSRLLQERVNQRNEENEFDSNAFKALLADIDTKEVKRIRKGDMVYTVDDPTHFLYYVKRGHVKTFKLTESGKEFVTQIYRDGDFFGYLTLLEDDPHRSESAQALENLEIIAIPKSEFAQLLFSRCNAAKQFIGMVVHDLLTAQNHGMKLAFDSARKRVAEALLFIFKRYGDSRVTIPLQRDLISSVAGITPESVSRNLSDFREEGLIQTSNGLVSIVDPVKLEQVVC